MVRKRIIGRKKECERLEEVLESDSSQLVVVYGRRRVGKTYLVNEFFGNDFAFKITGTYKQSREAQLTNFAAELSRRTSRKAETPKDWNAAFELLRSYMEGLDSERKQVFFFDEMPWLDTFCSGFLPAFEFFWNDFASTYHNVVFIVCGSASSWIVDNIENNKGGLFNRLTCRLYLKPFTLREVEEYLESRDIIWSRFDIVQLYMIMGGIPYYLSLLNRKHSLAQNIDRLFFGSNGELWDEYDHLYATLFSNSEAYKKIVEALSQKRSGLTRNEIIERTKLPRNGAMSKMLENLSDSGFIRISAFYGKKSKDALYQLSDYYTAFYLHFIRNHHGVDEAFWSNGAETSARKVWAGLTFEQLCMDHIWQIKQKLGISGVLSTQSIWYDRGGVDEDGTEHKGAQVDLLIDRNDHVVNICEMKFRNGEFEIDKEDDLNLRNKMESFRVRTSCRKTLQLTMITTYGVKRNKYVNIVSNQVVLDDLFV